MEVDEKFMKELGAATKDAVLAHLEPVNSELAILKAKTMRLETSLEKSLEQQGHLIEVIDALVARLS